MDNSTEMLKPLLRFKEQGPIQMRDCFSMHAKVCTIESSQVIDGNVNKLVCLDFTVGYHFNILELMGIVLQS